MHNISFNLDLCISGIVSDICVVKLMSRSFTYFINRVLALLTHFVNIRQTDGDSAPLLTYICTYYSFFEIFLRFFSSHTKYIHALNLSFIKFMNRFEINNSDSTTVHWIIWYCCPWYNIRALNTYFYK